MKVKENVRDARASFCKELQLKCSTCKVHIGSGDSKYCANCLAREAKRKEAVKQGVPIIKKVKLCGACGVNETATKRAVYCKECIRKRDNHHRVAARARRQLANPSKKAIAKSKTKPIDPFFLNRGATRSMGTGLTSINCGGY